MSVRLTSRRRIELPKAVLSLVRAARYFEMSVDNGRIVVTPLQPHSAKPMLTQQREDRIRAIQDKPAERGITEDDVAEAVREVRKEARENDQMNRNR